MSPGDRGQVILLGARWCAPCMAEWRDLGALVEAARPDKVVLAWVDRPIPPPPGLAGQVAILPVEQARALALKLGGEGYGLPMATYFPANVPGSAVPCAPWRAPLRPDNLGALRKLCRR